MKKIKPSGENIRWGLNLSL